MAKIIGYWCSRVNPKEQFSIDPRVEKYLDKNLWKPYVDKDQYPWPGDLIDPDFWKYYDKQRTVDYLKSGIPCNFYRGFSSCRICGEHLSSHERTDGTWCWPDKFWHYIESHDVRIPEEFLSFVSGLGYKVPSNIEIKNKTEIDDSFWIEWGKNGIPIHNSNPLRGTG